jgi:high-affinity nickel-transport protein
MPSVPEWLILGTAFALGLRHGIDWDHISAIMDITSGQKRARDGIVLGWFYAGGHSTVVAILGFAAVLVGLQMPQGFTDAMEFLVGATLIVLSLYVINMVVRHPDQDFRMRSRWVLIGSGIARLWERFVNRVTGRAAPEKKVHREAYGRLSAYAIGIVHGIGGETATQILLFVFAAGVRGAGLGLLVVLAWVLGLFVTNTVEAVLAAVGYAKSGNQPRLYRRIAIGAAIFSLVIGLIFLMGASGMLPSLG